MFKNIPVLSRVGETHANIFWAFALQIIEKGVGYVILAVLARMLLKTDLGAFFFCRSIADVMAVFITFGTNTLLIRLVASEPERSVHYLSRVVSFRLVGMVLIFALLNLTTYFAWPEIMPVMLLASASDFVEEIYHSFSAFFIGLKKMLHRFLILGSIRLLSLAGITLTALSGRGLFPILWAYLFFDLLLVFTSYFIVLRLFGPLKFRFDLKDINELFREGMPFFWLNILTVLHMRFDTIMVGAMLNLAQMAVYEIGIKLMEVTRFVIRPIGNVYFPVFSEHVSKGEWAGFKRRFQRLAGLTFLAGFALFIGMLVFGRPAMTWMFGLEYLESILPAQIIFGSVPFLFAGTWFTFAANAMHLEKKVAWITFVSVLLNLSLNVYVIPRFGISGAAWVTVISQIFQALGLFVLIQPRMSGK